MARDLAEGSLHGMQQANAVLVTIALTSRSERPVCTCGLTRYLRGSCPSCMRLTRPAYQLRHLGSPQLLIFSSSRGSGSRSMAGVPSPSGLSVAAHDARPSASSRAAASMARGIMAYHLPPVCMHALLLLRPCCRCQASSLQGRAFRNSFKTFIELMRLFCMTHVHNPLLSLSLHTVGRGDAARPTKLGSLPANAAPGAVSKCLQERYVKRHIVRFWPPRTVLGWPGESESFCSIVRAKLSYLDDRRYASTTDANPCASRSLVKVFSFSSSD